MGQRRFEEYIGGESDQIIDLVTDEISTYTIIALARAPQTIDDCYHVCLSGSIFVQFQLKTIAEYHLDKVKALKASMLYCTSQDCTIGKMHSL